MGSYERTCDSCGDSTITECWAPDECPFCELQKLREENQRMLAMLERLDEMLAGFNLYDKEQVVYGELTDLLKQLEGE